MIRMPMSGGILPWWREPERILFLSLLIAHLVPLWSFTYFPSQDGPAHLHNADVLREYGHPERKVFREFYAPNVRLETNWLSHFALARLMSVSPPLLAEKLLLTGYLLLLPLAARYALKAVSRDGVFLALLIFPFVNNFLLHMGFYNFCFSLAVFFLLLGAWIRCEGRPGAGRGAFLVALALLLGFCHILTLLVAAGAILLMALWLSVSEFLARRSSRHARTGVAPDHPWARLLWAAGILAPSLLFAVAFLGRTGIEAASPASPAKVLLGLARLETLVSFDERERWFSTGLVALFVLVALSRIVVKISRKAIRREDLLLAVAATLVAVSFLAPAQAAGGSFVLHRTLLFPFFVLILWLGGQEYSKTSRVIVQTCAAALAMALLALHVGSYAKINQHLAEYLSASEFIEPGTTLLPLSFAPYGSDEEGNRISSRVGVFLHTTGIIAVHKHAVDLGNYEANTDYFPIKFRPGKNPARFLPVVKGGMESIPPCVDLRAYEQGAGATIDYVLVWGLSDEYLSLDCTVLLLRQLGQQYERIAASRDMGGLQLFRRREPREP